MRRITVLAAVFSLVLLGVMSDSATAQCCDNYVAPVTTYVAPVTYTVPVKTYFEPTCCEPIYTPPCATCATPITPVYSTPVYRTSFMVRPRAYTRFYRRNCY